MPRRRFSGGLPGGAGQPSGVSRDLDKLADLFFSPPVAAESQAVSPETSESLPHASETPDAPPSTETLAVRRVVFCGGIAEESRRQCALDAVGCLADSAESVAAFLISGQHADCYVLSDFGYMQKRENQGQNGFETVADVLAECREAYVVLLGPQGNGLRPMDHWHDRACVLASPGREGTVEAYREIKSLLGEGVDPPGLFVVGAREPHAALECHHRINKVAERFLGQRIPLAGQACLTPEDLETEVVTTAPGAPRESEHRWVNELAVAGMPAEAVWSVLASSAN